MAHSVREQRDSPANQLRARLDEAERAVLRLSANQVESFLIGLDTIAERIQSLEAGGLDLRGERTRQESLVSRLEGEPRLVTAPAAQVGGLAHLRGQNPPATDAWWHLDAVEAEQRKRLFRRLLTSVGVLVGLLLTAYILLTYIFPPDPNAVLSSGATGQLPDLVARGEWEAADRLIAETLAQLTVEDVELFIWQSVVAEHLGRQEEADVAFAQAQALAPPERLAVFWSTVGNVRLAAGDMPGALVAANTALAIDPDEAQAYFVLASLFESEGDVSGAIDAFEKAFELAAENNPQLAVIARVRMGMLMQSAPSVAPVTATLPSGQ
ncbi:MAG: hypothetical protein KJZ86_08565 [Caldilineaceae bacterium]|nr:hypothetical protein [Caldilineaceae bacterium]HRJ43853.1 hypothetical protein [Caldilineaceae bacterium]